MISPFYPSAGCLVLKMCGDSMLDPFRGFFAASYLFPFSSISSFFSHTRMWIAEVTLPGSPSASSS